MCWNTRRTWRENGRRSLKMKARWYWNWPRPVVLELACGKGEYALGLGALYPEKNFIGIDIKGNRIWVGASKALKENMSNIAFIRSQIDKINDYFLPGEVTEIWITFPDPQLRTSKAKKRLTHPRFLRLYQRLLKTGGKIHLKTDSPDLYRFTRSVIDLYDLDLIESRDDLYSGQEISRELGIRTYYESLDIAQSARGLDIAQSARVFYLQFSLPDTELPDRDNELKELIIEQEAERRG